MSSAHSPSSDVEIVARRAQTEVVRERNDGKSFLVRRLTKEYPSREDIARLKYGATIAMNLDLPCVLKVLRFERRGESLVVVHADHGCTTLKKLIESGPMPLDRVLRIAIQLARALGELHRRRIVHKDIEPSNIFVVPDTGHVRISGFDIASQLDREMVMPVSPDRLEGNLDYMSPEQTGRMNRQIDYRTDFYSLGVVLTEMLTGHPVFQLKDPLSLVHAHIAIDPQPLHETNPAIPVSLSRVVQRLLAKNPEDRYQSAFGLTEDLRTCESMLVTGASDEDFVAGTRDVSMIFRPAQKLYGRDEPRQLLADAFSRASLGPLELVMVGGYSGIGKSALVNELQRPVLERRGYFISGKYDQFQNAPYSALILAFKDLVRQLLTESASVIASWKGRLQDALGTAGQVVVDVIPEVERIIGPQPPVPVLGPTESQNRFNLIFEKFVAALATEDRPIAVFIDDLQWADSGSLNLIKSLVQGSVVEHLLVIGSYRSNEVAETHPLWQVLDALRKSQNRMTEVFLGPLEHGDVVAMLSEMLSRKPDDELHRLASLVYRKTEGNPFFTNQFLTFLHSKDLISFDDHAGRWSFVLSSIEEVGISADVAGLIAERIKGLSDKAKRVLYLAACIGNTFDLKTLSSISETPMRGVVELLWNAISLEIIRPSTDAYRYIGAEESGAVPVAEIRYEFLHDRLQEAAYAQISPDERRAVHLRIGRLLLASTDSSTVDARTFDIVNQLNVATDLITDPDEKLRLARLNLSAGKRAKSAMAFVPAGKYLRVGVDLLPEDSWQNEYDLTFELSRHYTETTYMLGQHEEAEKLFDKLLAQAKTPMHRSQIFEIKSSFLSLRGKYLESTEAGIDAVRNFGVELATGPDEINASIERARLEAARLIADRDISSFADLPETTDEDERRRHELLSRSVIYGAYAYPQHFQLLAYTLVARAIKYGHSLGSASGYVTYAMLVGDPIKAYELGKVALAVSEKYDDLHWRAIIKFFFGTFINNWRRPISEAIPHIEFGYTGSYECGGVVYGGFAGLQTVLHRFLRGDELRLVRSTSRKYRDVAGRTNQPDLVYFIGAYEHIAATLGEKEIPAEDGVLSVATIREKLSHFPGGSLMSNMGFLLKEYILNQMDAALVTESLVASNIHFAFGHIIGEPELGFLHVLIFADRFATASAADQEKYRQTIQKAIERMPAFATPCPANFEHKYFIMQAEQARIEGRHEDAAQLYEKAIDSAVEHDCLYVQGIACELAGRLQLELGRKRIAQTYLRDAVNVFARWGAGAKVAQLRQRYANALPAAALEGGGDGSTDLDLVAIIKASQAISSEIVLSDLLQKLMRTALESAGAQRGFLLVTADNPFYVAAEQGSDGKVSVVLSEESIEARSDLALSIVRQVERSRERVVAADAHREARYQSDPHITRASVRSILCMPIVKQKKLVGVLYLENNLVSSAFTPRLCTVLDLLSAQAAISIENARLYDTLEQLVETRTKELSIRNHELGQALQNLKVTQRQLVTQEKLASLGALTSGIAHELKNPLNFVKNFAEHSIELVDSMKEMLEGQTVVQASAVEELVEVVDELSENMTTITQHGERANAIINGMLLHARDTSGQREKVDINKLVADSVELACHSARGDAFAFQIDASYQKDLGPVDVNPLEMRRVLINIISNALFSMRAKQRTEGSSYTPTLTVRTRKVGDRIEMTVRDNGLGIPDDILPKIFNPFFTTKKAGEGTGLGLSISHDVIVDGHQGEIRAESKFGDYAAIIITIPERAVKVVEPNDDDDDDDN